MSEMIYCRACGTKIHFTAKACPQCGAVQRMKRPEGKTRLAAALFAFFLGIFGAHKFYLGQIWLGILYLLFFWTFIPYIVSFIEFIIYLCMSDEEFDEKYNTEYEYE